MYCYDSNFSFCFYLNVALWFYYVFFAKNGQKKPPSPQIQFEIADFLPDFGVVLEMIYMHTSFRSSTQNVAKRLLCQKFVLGATEHFFDTEHKNQYLMSSLTSLNMSIPSITHNAYELQQLKFLWPNFFCQICHTATGRPFSETWKIGLGSGKSALCNTSKYKPCNFLLSLGSALVGMEFFLYICSGLEDHQSCDVLAQFNHVHETTPCIKNSRLQQLLITNLSWTDPPSFKSSRISQDEFVQTWDL